MGTAAEELAPVVARLKQLMLASVRIFADETTVPVLDPGRGRTKTGYFWAIARDDRPWGGTDPPAVVYTYALGRGHAHSRALLGGYRRILQVDGYAGYRNLADPTRPDPTRPAGPDRARLPSCWSHVRRGFYDLAKTRAAPLTTEALERILALYRIEAEIRGLSAAERQCIDSTAVPHWSRFWASG